MSPKILYLLDCNTAYKIGFTTPGGLKRRIRQLQTGNPERITIAATIAGSTYLEKRLHKMFAGSRKTGEWFDRDPKILEFFLSDQRG